jgi:uncharacterized coiled-coil protein SlyX
VIPLPKQHSGQGIEREVSLSAQGNPHYSPELDTAARFSKAMLDLYQSMVGESMFYRHQIYRQQVNGAGAIAQELKEVRATIANLKKKKRKDKRTIQELSEVIHEHNFLLQHNDQYMLDLENQLEAVAAPPPNPDEEEDPEEIWSGVWTRFTLSELRLEVYLVDVSYTFNKVMCCKNGP